MPTVAPPPPANSKQDNVGESTPTSNASSSEDTDDQQQINKLEMNNFDIFSSTNAASVVLSSFNKNRTCVQYRNGPKVAPRANDVDTKAPNNVSSIYSFKENDEKQQFKKMEMNELQPYSSANAAVPLAASLALQPGPFNFQQCKSRPFCFPYWSLPTIAPPTNEADSTLLSNYSTSSDDTDEQQVGKLVINEADIFSSTDAAVPLAASLALPQPGSYNFQQQMYPDVSYQHVTATIS